MKKLCITILTAVFVLAFSGAATRGESSAQTDSAAVKVAAIHFCPELGNVKKNVSDLLVLNEQAALNNAKIIVNTEMATCGYSFFSRADIAKVAETIPGSTTAAFGNLAKSYGVYIVLGLPQYDPRTQLYYNSAVLIGPGGKVLGVYHKRNSLMESSYNATDYGVIPTFNTPYGRIGIAICADTFYPVVARLEAIQGVDILAVPMNGGGPNDGFQVLAFENDFSVIVANRYGKEINGVPPKVFDQNTFTIASAYEYNFNYDCHTVIVNNSGEILADTGDFANSIVYGEIPVIAKNHFPVNRRPDLYGLMAQDTLQAYNMKNMGLPQAAVFAAAAVDPQNRNCDWTAAINAMTAAVNAAVSKSYTLKLIVLPANYFKNQDTAGIALVTGFCTTNNLDVVLHFGAETPPVSMLVTAAGEQYIYKRTHNTPGETALNGALSNAFFVIDRDYGRLALLQDKDLYAPETGVVMQKMAVDVIAVNADSNHDILTALWKTRTNNYLHLVVANYSAKEGIYQGGYIAYPSSEEAEGLVIMNMNTGDVRTKWEQRLVDTSPLLLNCH